jgi:hypothetical protein
VIIHEIIHYKNEWMLQEYNNINTMSEELFHELVAQFAEALPEKDSRDFSGTVGAIQLRNELKKQKQCGVSTRSSLKCKVLTDEIKEAARLEVKILELMSLIIKDRRVNGDEITFEKRDGAFGRSMIYAEIKKLYAIRYGKEETLRLDEAFNGL